MEAAHRVAVSILPSAAGGTHSAMLPTPATRAGAAHMRTVEGYAPAHRVRKAGPLHRPRQVGDGDAALDQVARRRPLVRVGGQDAPVGHLEGAPQVGIGVGAGLLDLVRGDPQPVGHVDLVQLGREANQRLVAPGPHLAQDPGHDVVHVGTGCVRARQGRVVRRRRAAQVQHTEGHEATRLPAAPAGPFQCRPPERHRAGDGPPRRRWRAASRGACPGPRGRAGSAIIVGCPPPPRSPPCPPPSPSCTSG